MTLNEVRQRYLGFFEKKGHTIIPSALLVPENDPTTLFTGSGMQPLVPYLLGQKHPQGDKLSNSQKCFRSMDIEDVGDNRHTTFFEMLGNWSLGSYWKQEQLSWFFEFLTKEIGIKKERLAVTCFEGDEKLGLPRDNESSEIWKKLGISPNRISFYGAKKNWWSRSGVPENMPAGEPGGPDSEVFYEFEHIEHDTKFGEKCHPNCDCGRFLEIGNSVFMEYKKNADGSFAKLPQQNVDFGGGLERICAVSENKNDIFETDMFTGVIQSLEKMSGKSYGDKIHTASFRVVADHVRSSVFLIGDGVNPSNTDQGYFVRRLLRRAIRYSDKLGIIMANLSNIVDPILEYYKDAYPETFAKKEEIKKQINLEEEKFRKTLAAGEVRLLKMLSYLEHRHQEQFTAKNAFDLYTTDGIDLETVVGYLEKNYPKISIEKDIVFHYGKLMVAHKDLSRAGSEKKFKGGLGDTSEMSVKYHTATHLLNAGLRAVLGTHVMQKGSNITPERLRFDFSHDKKMSDEEKKKVEDLVNGWIANKLPVTVAELPKAEAEKVAIHAFGDKYGDVVKVYSIGTEGKYISREFCGGPHVSNTGELGTFKIQKEEAVSQGVRRIKAILS